MILSYRRMLFAVSLILSLGTTVAAEVKSNAAAVHEREVQQVAAKSANGVRISIPLAALTSRDGIPGVFVVENNEARFRMVRPGKIQQNKVEILSGLFGGEKLITHDLEALHDGSPVAIVSGKTAGKK